LPDPASVGFLFAYFLASSTTSTKNVKKIHFPSCGRSQLSHIRKCD
jgi:hypothetical protein